MTPLPFSFNRRDPLHYQVASSIGLINRSDPHLPSYPYFYGMSFGDIDGVSEGA